MMITKTALLLNVLLIWGFPHTASAAERGTREEAIAMSISVVKMYFMQGAQKTFAAITNKEFNKGDLYPFIYGVDGVVRAHGQKPEFVGQDRLTVTDPLLNTLYVREFISVARTGSPAWVSYQFEDPLTKVILEKESYIVPINQEIFVGVGIYKERAYDKSP